MKHEQTAPEWLRTLATGLRSTVRIIHNDPHVHETDTRIHISDTLADLIAEQAEYYAAQLEAEEERRDNAVSELIKTLRANP